MISTEYGLMRHYHDHVVILSIKPRQCPSCKGMRCFLVNRDGRTLCMQCDHERKRKLP